MTDISRTLAVLCWRIPVQLISLDQTKTPRSVTCCGCRVGTAHRGPAAALGMTSTVLSAAGSAELGRQADVARRLAGVQQIVPLWLLAGGWLGADIRTPANRR